MQRLVIDVPNKEFFPLACHEVPSFFTFCPFSQQGPIPEECSKDQNFMRRKENPEY
jgi:hypothetical protein